LTMSDTSAQSQEALAKLRQKKELTAEEMKSLMRGVMSGLVQDKNIEEMLLLMRARGESAIEIAAAAEVLRENTLKLPKEFPDLLDTCGTGGDGQNTLNISTLAALVASASGARVAKHGNRSVSGVCGSADLLEMLGVRVELSPQSVARCLENTGFGFFFAPLFHPAVKAAMSARKRIQGKTLFNILGPLSNPAGARYQIVGVYEERLTQVVAHALNKLGCSRAMVVYGMEGLDEISLNGETKVAELKDGRVRAYTVVPEDFSLKREPLENIRCVTAADAKNAALKVLHDDNSAPTKIVCLNAAAALYICGKAASMKEGMLLAMDALDGGLVEKKLKAIVDFSTKAA
jgi:anthranilate phosphoribosyltransferase